MNLSRRPQVLFILGNHNHNTMLHAVARELPDCDRWFTPYYCDDWTFLDVLRRLRLLEFIPLGHAFREECLHDCASHGLPVDVGGKRGGYDLVVTCSDLVVPRNVRNERLVCVQEGMLDPKGFWYRVREHLPSLPRWAAATASTGSSCLYDRYCLASNGYVEEFVARGAPGHRLVVTGMPNFDDFAAHGRAVAEVKRLAPAATYLTDGSRGSGEELAANCEALITEWSTLAFIGLAFGKETYSYRDLEEVRRLLPLQHGRAAKNIADVCREVLAMKPVMALAAAPAATV
jgi:hypothetical protein